MKYFSAMKYLAVTGATQDEQVLRRAERMEKDRNTACAEIRARMQKNTVCCKQTLAEAKKIGEQLAAHFADLDITGGLMEQSRNTLTELRRNTDAQMKLDERKGDWQSAIRDWMDAAHGKDPNSDSDNPGTTELSKLLVEYLARGEKNGGSAHATAVIVYDPLRPISECVRVASTSEAIGGFKDGQLLRKGAKTKTAEVEAVWTVLETGSAYLSNQYDHPDEAATAFSVVPLTSTSRHRFGAIVSGPPAVPDEYLEKFAATAGQMFERIGKLEIMWRILGYVQTFIEEQCTSAHKLVYVKFIKGAGPTKVNDNWAWQPLEYMHPTNEKRFELPLKFEGGEQIGLFTVECGSFTQMDEGMLVLLHTIAGMLLDAVKEVGHMELGYEPPLSSPGKVLSEYESRENEVADALSSSLSRCVKTSLIFHNSLVEAATYCAKVEDENTIRLMQAILTLAGKPAGDPATVKKQLRSAKDLVEALASISIMADTPVAMTKAASMPSMGKSAEKPKPLKKGKSAKKAAAKQKTKWNVAEAYVKSVDFAMLEQKAPVPICIMLRWFKMARHVYNIGVTLRMPKDETVNPVCAKTFKEIDVDKSGALSTKEMITYMAGAFDAEAVMSLLKVMDTNSDGKVTWDEWLKAWQNGDFEIDVSDEDGESSHQGKLLSKHLTRGRNKLTSQPTSTPSWDEAPAAAATAEASVKGKRKSSSSHKDRVAPANGNA